ncbi:MAG: hypothetical protein WBG86_22955, partial [Polyangiales bacterium]
MILACAALCGCTPKQAPVEPPTEASKPIVQAPTEEAPEVVLEDPVPFWDGGTNQGQVDAARAAEEGVLLVDLGEDWTPFIFTNASGPEEEPKPMGYRDTYLALARGEFPKDRHGERARKDKYLELYGILPTLNLLRTRFDEVSTLECAGQLDLAALQS